jgi:hypothetical protein
MGVGNKQRRAAKKKARKRRPGGRPWVEEVPPLSADLVRALLQDVVREIWDDSDAAGRCAALLLAPGRSLTPELARAGLQSFLADLLRVVTTRGWSPDDIVQITRRRASDDHVPLAVGLLEADLRRYAAGQVPSAWADDVRRAGPASPLSLSDATGMQQALELAAVLAQLPEIAPVRPRPGVERAAGWATPADEKLVARVQALLAKAEATEFDDEAEALSAKAQELVSRYALERVLAHADSSRGEEEPVARRLWIESPYVFPKAMLVHVVAGANRSRSVVSEKLGFCTVVGHRQDLDALELLVPSLLVQAHAALRRYGRQSDRRGTSRTRSFRQSFLLAYAERIGERLRAASDDATSSSGRGGDLVPLLQRHADRVQAACDELFPHLVAKAGTAGNTSGWAAGRAAADVALLGSHVQLAPAR